MKRVWASIKKWWWAALAAVGLVTAWIFLGTRKKRVTTKEELLTGKPTTGTIESLRQIAVIEAEKASTDVLIEKARADTKVEARRNELDRIKKEPDPIARRRRLAAWASTNL